MLAVQWAFCAGWHEIIRQMPKRIPAPNDRAQQAKQRENVVHEQLQTMQNQFVLLKVQFPMQKEHIKRSRNVLASW